MKNTFLFLLLSWSAAAQQQPQQAGQTQQRGQFRGQTSQQQQAPATGTAAISGRVTDAAGAPVRRAVVTVEGESRQARTAKSMTGDDGTFSVKELAKGKYWITAEKTGYLRGSYRGRTTGGYGDPVEVADGAERSGVDILLAQQGVIAGRVLDEAGEPAERVMVQAIPVRKTTGRGMGTSTMTNDLGEFRIAKLPPGNYRLLASRGNERGGPVVEQAAGKTAMTEAPTYFPSTVDINSATPIHVQAGEQQTGSEIRLQRSTVVRVAGRIAGELPTGTRGTRVTLRASGEGIQGLWRGGPASGNGDGVVRADGTFEFRNVRPGEYALAVVAMDRGGPKTLGKQALVVGQQDINGVTIMAAPPPKVDGRVRADGDPPFPFGTVDVSLIGPGPGGGFGGRNSVKTDASGNFSFPAVSRERQVISVKAPEGTVVKAIYAGGQPLPGADVDFSMAAGPLEIVLSNKPASVAGSVEGTSPDAPRVAVWAVPDAQPLTIESWNTKKVRIASDAPTFTLDALAAGTYRIAAFEEAESDALSDPAVWEQFRDRTVTVKVGEGETGQAKVKLIAAKELEGQ